MINNENELFCFCQPFVNGEKNLCNLAYIKKKKKKLGVLMINHLSINCY